jgi:hypothetical protein
MCTSWCRIMYLDSIVCNLLLLGLKVVFIKQYSLLSWCLYYVVLIILYSALSDVCIYAVLTLQYIVLSDVCIMQFK